MNNKHSSHPLICIDFKKNRIRIHRNTLRQIGNPEYIQLLVNPDQKMIGIKASCAEDKLAHKVKERGSIGFLLDQQFSRKTFNYSTVFSEFDKAVMLFGCSVRQRLEPVRVVCDVE